MKRIFHATPAWIGRVRRVTKHYPKCLERNVFPPRVFDLPNPPERLFLLGELPRGPSVAVIGTRNPTDEAVAYTGEIVRAFAASGLSIWSGGAKGIDMAAHRAALRAHAPTVVVAPAGWCRPYPPEHAEDYSAIVEAGGAYLSIVAPEQAALRHSFFPRNELLVALVDVVVVVQAGVRSGARNAAKSARQLGRLLFVVPSCPWVHRGLGCNLEIELGARVLLTARDTLRTCASLGIRGIALERLDTEAALLDGDLANARPLDESRAKARSFGEFAANARTTMPNASERRRVDQCPASTDIDVELARLLEAIREGSHHVDELCLRTGLAPAVVQSDVLRLTLLGLVRTDRTGTITLVTT